MKSLYYYILLLFSPLLLQNCTKEASPEDDPAGEPLPVITTQPVNATVNIGASVTFSVVATGNGLSYQWQKDSVTIAGATAASYTFTPTANLTNTTYRCIVSNTAGSVTSANATLTVIAYSLSNIKPLLDQYYFVSEGATNADGTGGITNNQPLRSIPGKPNGPGGRLYYGHESEPSITQSIPNRFGGGVPKYYEADGGYVPIANGNRIGYRNFSDMSITTSFEEIHVLRLHGGKEYEALISAKGNGNGGDLKRWGGGKFQYRDHSYSGAQQLFTFSPVNFETIIIGIKTNRSTGVVEIWVSDKNGDIRTIFTGTCATNQTVQVREIGTIDSHPYSMDWFASMYKYSRLLTTQERETINANLKGIYPIGKLPAKSFCNPTLSRNGSIFTLTPNYVLRGSAASINTSNTIVRWYMLDNKINGAAVDPLAHFTLLATTNGSQLTLNTASYPQFVLVEDEMVCEVIVYDNLGLGFVGGSETDKIR